MDAGELGIFLDSKLVVCQVEGSFEARDPHMSTYLKLVGTLQACFRRVSVAGVPRGQNSHANSLATLALSLDECVPRMIFVELLGHLSIEHRLIVAVALAFDPSWMDLIISFLADGSLPTDIKEAKNVRRMSFRFWLSKDKKLY